MNIDNETKGCAAAALRNAYQEALDNLLQAYLNAAEGLGMAPEMLWEVHSFGGGKDPETPNIWTGSRDPGNPSFYADTCGASTALEALQHPKHLELHIAGRKVFERSEPGGEWQYVEVV